MEANELQDLKKRINPEMEEKWFEEFTSRARYLGNKTYNISNLYSNDTRELFLMFIGQQELKMKFD